MNRIATSRLRWFFPSFAAAWCCAISTPLLFSWQLVWVFAPVSTLMGTAALTFFIRFCRSRKKLWLVVIGGVCVSITSTVATIGIVFLEGWLKHPSDASGAFVMFFVSRYSGLLGLALLVIHAFWFSRSKIIRCTVGGGGAAISSVLFLIQEAMGTKLYGELKLPFVFIPYNMLSDVDWGGAMMVLAVIIGSSYSVFLPSDSVASEDNRGQP